MSTDRATSDLYAEGRRRICALLEDLDGHDAATVVPACPGWSVADVVAHLAGACADIVAGNIAGAGSPDWTDAQVTTRRGRSIAELIGEWDEVGPRAEALAVHFPPTAAAMWIMDLTSHEHDLRGALGRPGARDSDGIEIGLRFLVEEGLSSAVREQGLLPLEVRAGDLRWVAGPSDDERPGAAVEATPWELLRALTGRRSVAQIRDLSWTGSPDPYLPALRFGPFSPASEDLAE